MMLMMMMMMLMVLETVSMLPGSVFFEAHDVLGAMQ